MNIKGDFLFAIPARDTLLVAGTEESDEFKNHLTSTAKRVMEESSYYLTDTLFIYIDGVIKRYDK